jgi:hypothetical protein
LIIPTGLAHFTELDLTALLSHGTILLHSLFAQFSRFASLVSLDHFAATSLQGLPWSISKGMDTFNPLSNVVAADTVPDPHALEMWLKVNGERRMHTHTSLMIHRIPQLIEAISARFTLEPGDLSA